MKTLLITGGTGFIGRMLTQRALAAGYRVRVLSRDPDKARRQLPGISAFSDIGQAFAEPADVLVNLAGRIGSGRQWMSWISRTDHVSLMLYAMEHEQLEGPLNATAPEPVTNREFTQTLARQLRRPALIPLPAPVVRGVLGEMGDELLLASQRVVPAKALESCFRFEHPTLTQALRTALAD